MANRYWVSVLSADNWNGAAGTKWATTSGGAGGAAEPTSADDVFFDAASSFADVTASGGNRPCKSLNLSGFTKTFDTSGSGRIVLSGNLTLGTTIVAFDASTSFIATAVITSNGKTINGDVHINAPAGTVSLADNLTLTSSVTVVLMLEAGTFNANNKDVFAYSFFSDYATARTLTMGSGTWTISGSGGSAWDCGVGTNLTLNANTSTLKFTSTASISFTGGSKTYNILRNEGAHATSNLTILGSNTFAQFIIAAAPRLIKFENGSTQTITTTWNVSGTAGNLITLHSQSAGQPWSLSKSSGAVLSDYVALRDSQAIGGATFTATNFTDEGGNSGWIGTTPPSSGKYRMFLIFSLLLAALVNSNMSIGTTAMRRMNGIYYERASRSYKVSRGSFKRRRRNANRPIHSYPRRLQILRSGGEKNSRVGGIAY